MSIFQILSSDNGLAFLRGEAEIQRSADSGTGGSASEGLSPALRQFIKDHIPTFAGAELLLFLSRHAEVYRTADEIVIAMRPSVILLPAAREYLALFASRGLLESTAQGFRYQPANAHLREMVAELAQAYEERPVTLIRTVYDMTDSLRSFLDSFNLKNE
jgi:hypothetical protein